MTNRKPQLSNNNLYSLTTVEMEKKLIETVEKLTKQLEEYNKYLTFLNELENIQNRNHATKELLEKFEELTKKQTLFRQFLYAIKNDVNDYHYLYQFSLNNNPKNLEIQLSDIEYKLKNLYPTFDSSAKYTQDIKKKSEDIKNYINRIKTCNIENLHLYTFEYMNIFKLYLPNINKKLSLLENSVQKLPDKTRNIFGDMNKINDAKLSTYLRNNQLFSWDDCIHEINKKLNILYSEKERKDSRFFAASYLLHLVFSGKIKFSIISNQISISKETSEEYSFKEAYDHFISNISDGIYFDTLSPQYLPYADENKNTIRHISTKELSSPNKKSDPFDIVDFISKAEVKLYHKPKNNKLAQENWVLKIARKNSYRIDQLLELPALRFDDVGRLLLPNLEENISYAPIKEDFLSYAEQFYYNNKDYYLHKVDYPIAFDKELREDNNLLTHGVDYYNPNGVYARTINAKERLIDPPTQIYFISQQLKDKKDKKVKRSQYSYPLIEKNLPYDNHFSKYFDEISKIYTQQLYINTQFPYKSSIKWNNLFYLFLYSQGISFTNFYITKNHIRIPAGNGEIIRTSQEITTFMLDLSRRSNITVEYMQVSFFRKMCFSKDNIGGFLTEDTIEDYYDTPYKNLLKDSKLTTHNNFISQNIKYTKYEKMALALQKLLSEPNMENMFFCTAYMCEIANTPHSKISKNTLIFNKNISALIEMLSPLKPLFEYLKNKNYNKLEETVNDLQDENNSKLVKIIIDYFQKEISVNKNKQEEKEETSNKKTTKYHSTKKNKWTETIDSILNDFKTSLDKKL